jgi:hypothetical protein
MILTVTPNTALDQVVEIPHYEPGHRLDILKETECMGGKGNLASGFIADLGAKTVSLAFAAGRNGRRLAALLRERGARPDLTIAGGETRRILVVVDERRAVQTWLVPITLRVNRQIERDLEQRVALAAKLRGFALRASAGLLAEDYYALTSRVHQIRADRCADRPLPISSRGRNCAPQQELELTLGRKVPDTPALIRELRHIVEGINCHVLARRRAVAVRASPMAVVPPNQKLRGFGCFHGGDHGLAQRGATWPEAVAGPAPRAQPAITRARSS